jgi:hypothetical protein
MLAETRFVEPSMMGFGEFLKRCKQFWRKLNSRRSFAVFGSCLLNPRCVSRQVRACSARFIVRALGWPSHHWLRIYKGLSQQPVQYRALSFLAQVLYHSARQRGPASMAGCQLGLSGQCHIEAPDCFPLELGGNCRVG